VGLGSLLLSASVNCCMLIGARQAIPAASVCKGQWQADVDAYIHSAVMDEVFYPEQSATGGERVGPCAWSVFTWLVLLAIIAAPLTLVTAAVTASSGDGSTWYSLALIPFYLAAFCSPVWCLRDRCFSGSTPSQLMVCSSFTLCLALPLALVAGFGAARADGVNEMEGWAIMMPVFVLHGIVSLAGCIGCTGGTCSNWRQEDTIIGKLAFAGLFVAGMTLQACTLIVLELLIVLRIDGGYSATWGQISVPIYLVLVPIIILASIAGISNMEPHTAFLQRNRLEIVA
jgi:hypothetical protein